VEDEQEEKEEENEEEEEELCTVINAAAMAGSGGGSGDVAIVKWVGWVGWVVRHLSRGAERNPRSPKTMAKEKERKASRLAIEVGLELAWEVCLRLGVGLGLKGSRIGLDS